MPNPNHCVSRIDNLIEKFAEAFPEVSHPIRVCRAPGRINLLGEHLDYNGLPVLPTTIQHDICIAFTPRDDHVIRLKNADPRFSETAFTNTEDIPPSETGAWENYCKAAIQALNRRFPSSAYRGMNLYVDGNIPTAAGLSSSSAFVVACALAYLAVSELELDKDISRIELATLLAEGEHYVGTRGGGMDQAIILLGAQNCACKIDFFPLRTERVPLFEDHVFVAAHSLVKADKTGSALQRYNAGPATCRLLTALIEHAARQAFDDEIELERLGDLWQGPLFLTHEEAEALVRSVLSEKPFSMDELSRFLNLSPQAIREKWLGALEMPPEGLPLHRRARHVLTEFHRVERGRDFLLAKDAAAFGELMSASHRSCASDYEVSCPELDELTEIARQAGALGSRMTGAGFGGYTVSLVPQAALLQFLQRVYEEYYRPRGMPPDEAHNVLWAAAPSSGAGYTPSPFS
ncbi:MAG TPA: galactokinase [Candidatus Hydrogenedentes bacterium]|nr:galactokinase [Candidatus Hydrogenedentota bacterium]HOL76296.1 galactokinase [Candidatus Hydrogenedentota bacterium]HPO86123.1 galactokinase [Candidatus Hydrogenedentota bacterium]